MGSRRGCHGCSRTRRCSESCARSGRGAACTPSASAGAIGSSKPLAEYRRLHAGLGQLRAPSSVLRAPCPAADASEAAPRLTHDYEQLLGAHEATLERVRAFLRLAPPPPPAAADAAADIRTVCQGDARQAVRGGEQLWRAVHRVRRGRRRRVRALSRRAVRLRRARGGCGTAGAAQRYVAGVTERARDLH